MINLVTEVTTLYFVKLVSYIFINIVFFSIYFILENLETNNKYQKLIIENRENTLAVLTNQINPHFLMNTFNNLYATIALKDQESGDIILKLSNLLRYSFQVNRKPLVTIGEELEYIKNYISLEELRLDKLSINFNEQIPNKEIQIAPMLLITLLENAFKHGISEVTHSAWLNIDLVVQNKTLFILIENSKPTIKTNTLISGSGLKNLEKRLSLQYPERHNLYIEDDNVSFKVTLQIEL
ncbi:histidine kinase [uncultured Aquimarina sp.]|uniref:sensor histidine kinase n=1 Tax=uncultured Aquimarina sp. TaxID=575652 RepID=UPI00262E6EF2|nr:histidine kinase [uncultured Aquimarina sp.]